MTVVKIILSIISMIILTGLLLFYWFMPLSENKFEFKSNPNSNFTIAKNSEAILQQFYPNMRYPDKTISYKIDNCPLQKKNDIEQAFNILSEKTVIDFYASSAEKDGEIFITCDSNEKIEGNLIIAGEGGPTKIIKTEDFNIIIQGKVLIREESSCPQPNIAIHEILHALGFEHSSNPSNIMYNISKCNQEVGQDTIILLDTIYSIPSLPDLSIENASAKIDGRYLDMEFAVKNNGLKKARFFNVSIYADSNWIKNVDIEELDFGEGSVITLKNIWLFNTNVRTIKLEINYAFEEINKKNNEAVLELSL